MRRSGHQRPWAAGHVALASRHVEELSIGEPDRVSPHRLVRLLVTAGSAAAGLCLVVGLSALMVALGARQHGWPRASSQHTRSPGHGRRDGHGNGNVRAVGRALTGKGGRRGLEVHVERQSTWGLAWSFRCPAGRSGAFTVRAADAPASRDPLLRRVGEHRTGVWWNANDRGVHAVHIVSGCPWRAHIVLPGRARHRSASPRPGNHRGPPPNRGQGHRRKHGHGQKASHSPKPKHSHKPKHTPGPDPTPGPQQSP